MLVGSCTCCESLLKADTCICTYHELWLHGLLTREIALVVAECIITLPGASCHSGGLDHASIA